MNEEYVACGFCLGCGDDVFMNCPCKACDGKGYFKNEHNDPTRPSHYHTGNINVNKCTHCRGKGTAGGSSYVFEACAYCHGIGRVPVIQHHIDRNEILKEVQDVLRNQTAKGIAKYGHTVDAGRLSTIEWIDHAIEESMDKIVYLTCIKKSLERGKYERD